jgi:hypothetical protein
MPLISSISAGVRVFGLYVLSALVTIIDTFNRPNNTADLGSAGGQKWKILRGAWQILSNKANSASTPATNALATLTFTKTDVNISVSGAEPGLGASFWVTDAENWYATVYVQQQVCQTCSNCNAWNTSFCTQWNAINCGAWNAGGNCSLTDNGNCAKSGQFCCQWASGTCNGWNTSNIICGAWNAQTCPTWNNSNSFCTGWNNNNCPTWNPGGVCKTWGTGGKCNGWNNQNCASGWNARNCAQSAWNSRNCASGWTAGFCIPTAWNVNNCPSWNNVCNGNCCSGPFANWGWHCIQWNNSNCAWNTGGNCQFANSSNCNSFFSFSCNCVVEHRLRILRSIANTVSEISNSLFSLAINSFKLLLSGSQATIQAFSTSTYNSQIGNSVTTSISSPVKTKQHGIIKSSSSHSQGSSIDEFGVS